MTLSRQYNDTILYNDYLTQYNTAIIIFKIYLEKLFKKNQFDVLLHVKNQISVEIITKNTTITIPISKNIISTSINT